MGVRAHGEPVMTEAASPSLREQDMLHRAHLLAVLQTEVAQLPFSLPAAGSDIEDMDVMLARRACEIFECEAGGLTLINQPEDGWMISKVLISESSPRWIYQIMPIEGGGVGREALRTCQVQRADLGALDARFDLLVDGWGDRPVRNLLVAPMLINGQSFGLLRLINRRGGDFDAFDEALLRMLAAQAAALLHGARMVQQLKVANADLEAGRWELLASRNTLRALFDHLPTSLYIINQDYRLEAVNLRRASQVEKPPQALVGQICYTALFGRASPCPGCRVRETLEDGRVTQREEHRYTADEMAYDWEISAYPIPGDQERVSQAILVEQDLSERRRLEAVLTQSEKLAAIGQLAAGVAHEINNPLTAIIANAQILHRELPLHSDMQESVDLIARAGARAAQVVHNLLDFARKEEVHLGLTDINETIERALELIQHELLARGVHLLFTPDPALPAILASYDQLQSVWLNLLLNAIDALDKSPAEIKISAQRVDGGIQVIVADNGRGIPPDQLTRIFDPFYTTKAPGRGTGLGLSVTHRIIKQHAGRIGVESQLGGGSIFTVVLPTS